MHGGWTSALLYCFTLSADATERKVSKVMGTSLILIVGCNPKSRPLLRFRLPVLLAKYPTQRALGNRPTQTGSPPGFCIARCPKRINRRTICYEGERPSRRLSL